MGMGLTLVLPLGMAVLALVDHLTHGAGQSVGMVQNQVVLQLDRVGLVPGVLADQKRHPGVDILVDLEGILVDLRPDLGDNPVVLPDLEGIQAVRLLVDTLAPLAVLPPVDIQVLPGGIQAVGPLVAAQVVPVGIQVLAVVPHFLSTVDLDLALGLQRVELLPQLPTVLDIAPGLPHLQPLGEGVCWVVPFSGVLVEHHVSSCNVELDQEFLLTQPWLELPGINPCSGHVGHQGSL